MKNILLTPYPPPYAGPEVISKIILKTNTFSNRDDVIHINSTINDINAYKGEFRLQSVILYFRVCYKLVRIAKGDSRIFMYVSSSRLGFFKDSIFIFILFLLKKRTFAQYHGSNFKNFYNTQSFDQ